MATLRTDFLLADNAHARWVRRSDVADDFVTVQEIHAEPAQPTHPLGVVFESGGGRFSVEEKHGGVEEHRYRFAGRVAEAINAKVAEHDLHRLCLVAPARTLAAIRRRLTPDARTKLAHVLAKDLIKTPDHRLGDWLQALELN